MKRMFRQPAYPAACAAVALALLATVGAAVPAGAADAPAPRIRVILAAADTAAMPAAAQPVATAATMTSTDKHVEARIKDLHSRLGITAAQEDAWSKVAQAMRENAATMSTLTQTRTGKAKTMTAVDDLKSYAEIAQAHADGIQKFTPVFGSLYDSMSDQQKLNADTIFRAHGRKSMKHMTAKAG